VNAYNWRDEKSVTVVGDGLKAVVLPERGGKIGSLVDASGYDWLSAPEAEPSAPARPGASFLDADMSGWDECAPTVTASRLADGTDLPDHGDLWDTGWIGNGQTLLARGRSLPYTFERTITAVDDGLRFDYTVTATERPMPFLWVAHPQFLAPPGTRVAVAAHAVVDALANDPRELEWSHELSTIDTIPAGQCRKVYLSPDEHVNTTAIEVPGHGRLSLRWDAQIAPYLGLWFDHARYAPQSVIAIEPSTGFFDSAASAESAGRVLMLEPGVPVSWFVDLTVE
jgi:hypothetical protein